MGKFPLEQRGVFERKATKGHRIEEAIFDSSDGVGD